MCYCLPYLLCYKDSLVLQRSWNAPILPPGPAGRGRYGGSSCLVLPSWHSFTRVCMGGSQMAARGPMMEPVLPTMVCRRCKADVSPTIVATRGGRRAGQGRSLHWPPRDFPSYSGSTAYNLIQHTVVKCQHGQATALGEPGLMWTAVRIVQIMKQTRLGALFASISFHEDQANPPNIPGQPQDEVFSGEERSWRLRSMVDRLAG